jgi:hypothetical protein
MPLSRREEVAKILHVNGVLLLEDDAYVSEFSQNGVVPRGSEIPGPGPLRSLLAGPVHDNKKHAHTSDRMNRKMTSEHSSRARGKLKIGDDWNAITIIALSQTSPLKAIAELVENSIDAKASTVTITRGREHRRHFLSIRDDGEGVPRDGRISATWRRTSVILSSAGSRPTGPRAYRASSGSAC